MHRYLRTSIFAVCITIFLLILFAGRGAPPSAAASAATATLTARSTRTATPTRFPTRTPTPRPTQTATPALQPGAKPLAWLDQTISGGIIRADGVVVIHFNTPMALDSSAQPLLIEPEFPGVSRWNADGTLLTFTPDEYILLREFSIRLDAHLTSSDGQKVTSTSRWKLKVRPLPEVREVDPDEGRLLVRAGTVYVHFSKPMQPRIDPGLVSVEPAVPFALKWETDRKLAIQLSSPLQIGQRYRFTLQSGWLDTDGMPLARALDWQYSLPKVSHRVELVNAGTLKITFNYRMDQEKSARPFEIQPPLEGEWVWSSQSELLFKAAKAIPSSQEFELVQTGELVESAGGLITGLSAKTFTGVFPIRLVNVEEESSHDNPEGVLILDCQERSLKIQFDVPVDHASAQRALSITPAIPGSISWEPGAYGSEYLVYNFSRLLEPHTDYALTLDTHLRDTSAKPLILIPFRVNLQTSYLWELWPSFGMEGANIQLVDADGPRRLDFSDNANYRGGTNGVKFSAYRLELVDFINLYPDFANRNLGKRYLPLPDGLESTQTWTNITPHGDRGPDYTTLPSSLEPGLYVVNLYHQNTLYDQMFVALTRNTLVVKENGSELVVWLTDILGGPVADAEIRLYDRKGSKVREGATGEDGIYRVSIPAGSEPLLVTARVRKEGQPDDVTLSGFTGWDTYMVNDWDHWSWFEPVRPATRPYLAYLYTERPIYRPGQTVYFKAVLRKDDDVRYSLPDANTLVNVRLKDARGNTLARTELRSNAYGTVHGSFGLPEGGTLGAYTLETDVDGAINETRFQVEDYRKPDIRLTLTDLQPEKMGRYIQGEEVRLQVNAAYLFGQPLVQTRLSVELQYHYLWYEQDTKATAKITGTLVTDAQGNTSFSFKAPYRSVHSAYDSDYYDPDPVELKITASVDDGSLQRISATTAINVYPTTDRVALDTGHYFQVSNRPFTLNLQDSTPDGDPVPGRSLTLNVQHQTNDIYRVDKFVLEQTLLTDGSGKASLSLSLDAGWYRIEVTGRDDLENKFVYTDWVYVFREARSWSWSSPDIILKVTLDKAAYRPYETARIAIESSFSGPALLTFERGRVINTRLIELTAPLTLVDAQIIPEHAPNVFVTVNAWQPANCGKPCRDWRHISEAINRDTLLRLAKTEVQVTADAKALQIAIEPEKAVYAPGESMRAVIRVTDSAGKPVRAELSLAVVDEAIFLLKDEMGAGIFNAFYGPRRHSVTTFDSMQPYRYIPGSYGGGGNGVEIPDSVLRDNFPDTTTWLPAIETDSQGQAVVELTLPDNTTSWRLTAKAVTRTHQVGEAFTQIETRKEVFVRPVLPRVLTRGDQASLTAFVHNTGSQAQNLTMKLSAPGLQLLDEASQTVTVPPGVSQRVEWPVRVAVSTPTEATISLAGAQGVVDAVRLPLLIQPAAILERQHVAGLTDGEATLAVNLPEVDVETSQVTLNLTRSPAGTLLNGLEFLIGYPYGCVEQTMSRALPNAVVSQAASRLNIGGPKLKATLDPMIQASIYHLYGLQHSDGGWGWWTDDDSTPYQTAWVLYGLGVMSHAGYEIDPDVIQNAVEWLDGKYSYRGELDDPREEIYARFAMAEAGFGDLQRVRALAAQEDYALDPFSRAALALALYDLGDVEQARIQLGLLNQDVQVKDEMAFWSTSTGDGEYRSKTMASTVRSTALALIANTRIEPENPLILQAVNYLVAQRKGNRGWGTTNETSYTILALVDALALQDQQAEDSTYAVLLNGKPLADGALNAAQPNVRVVIPVSQMKPGKNAVQLQTNDESLVYYDLNADLDTLQIPAEPAGTIEVERRYLDPSTGKPLEEIQAGQLVQVELKVNTQQPLDYVAVEDHLPGGLEALNEGLNTQNWASTEPNWYDYGFFRWMDYGYNYKEIRADRVVFFVTRDFRNSRTFTYMARATTSGTFLALPAQVYAMYDLSMWGRSGSAEVVIKR